jgi:hypothetical protein
MTLCYRIVAASRITAHVCLDHIIIHYIIFYRAMYLHLPYRPDNIIYLLFSRGVCFKA